MKTKSSKAKPVASVAMMATWAFFGFALAFGWLGGVEHLDDGAFAGFVYAGDFVLLGKELEQGFVVLEVAVAADVVALPCLV